MSKVYICELKDSQGLTHVHIRGSYNDVIDRITTYPTDNVPLLIDEKQTSEGYFIHFILL